MGKERKEEAEHVDGTSNHSIPSHAIECRKLMVPCVNH